MPTRTDPLRVAFVCVENAGRSQIAEAVAETHLQLRGRDDVAVQSGGTNPADELHPGVVEVMAEKGYDLSERFPRKIGLDELASFDVVTLMGCSISIDDVPAGVVVRDWGFIDPASGDYETIWAISADIERRVIELLDDLPTSAERDAFQRL